MRLVTMAVLLSVVGVLSLAAGEFPRQLSYQGTITDDMGNPVTQNGLSVRYFLYPDSSGGAFLWAEVTMVDIVDGQLSHYLGSSCPTCDIPDSVFFDQDTLWLEVMVDGEPIQPRTKLVAYPFAYRVASIDKTTGGTVTGEINLQSAAAGNALEVSNTGGGRAGYFQIANVGNSESAVIATTNGSGTALEAVNDGGGNSGIFRGGTVEVQDIGFATKLRLNSLGAPSGGGFLSVHSSTGAERISLNGDWFGAGFMRLSNPSGVAAIELDGSSGHLAVHDETTAGEVNLYTGGTFGGLLTANALDGTQTVELGASENGSNGGYLSLIQADGTPGIKLYGEETGGGSAAYMYNSLGNATLRLEGDGSNLPGIYLRNSSGTDNMVTIAAQSGAGGGGGGGLILVSNAAGSAVVTINGNDNGDGRVTTEVLEITGGSDLSEQFDIQPSRSGATPQPGMVVSIDTDRAGRLKICERAYDPAVAGIISGANGIKPGMMMGQSGTVTDGEYAVALTGRVYCLVDASYGAVEPGSLLTTSPTAGHAMVASDAQKAPGAVIGKAMSSLESGQGYVLVLVSLQ